MIPCHICGKDASTSWIKGFTPGPDSQKMALCAEHNSPENRLAVANAWQRQLLADIEQQAGIARQRNSPAEQVLSVHFTGGGMLSFICTACDPTEHGTLRIAGADGSQTFIPLRHVRDYALRPLLANVPAGQDAKAGPEALENAAGQQITSRTPQKPAALPGTDSGDLKKAAAVSGEAFFNKVEDKVFSVLALPSRRRKS